MDYSNKEFTEKLEKCLDKVQKWHKERKYKKLDLVEHFISHKRWEDFKNKKFTGGYTYNQWIYFNATIVNDNIKIMLINYPETEKQFLDYIKDYPNIKEE